MAESRNQHRIKADDWFEFQIRRRVKQWTHAKVDAAFTQLLQPVHSGYIVQGQRNSGVPGCEFLNRRWKDVLDRRFACCNRKMPTFDPIAARFEVAIQSG